MNNHQISWRPVAWLVVNSPMDLTVMYGILYKNQYITNIGIFLVCAYAIIRILSAVFIEVIVVNDGKRISLPTPAVVMVHDTLLMLFLAAFDYLVVAVIFCITTICYLAAIISLWNRFKYEAEDR